MSKEYNILPLRVYFYPFVIIKKAGKDVRQKFKYANTYSHKNLEREDTQEREKKMFYLKHI